MSVRTTSAGLESLRREILGLVSSEHARDVSRRTSEAANSNGCSQRFDVAQVAVRPPCARRRRSIASHPTSASIPRAASPAGAACTPARRSRANSSTRSPAAAAIAHVVFGPGERFARERLHGVRRLRGPLPDRSDHRSRPRSSRTRGGFAVASARWSRSRSPSAATAASVAACGSRAGTRRGSGSAACRRRP